MVRRLCCGQEHDDLPCPDGLVMCCLCFSRVPVSELNEPTPGHPEDVCKPCARAEQTHVNSGKM
jgi:hypothetical protein